MSKDLEEALKVILRIMEEHELTSESLFKLIKEYEELYIGLHGKHPNQVFYVENNNHKMLEIVKDAGNLHYRNLVGSDMKVNGELPSKPRREVFHINEEGKELSYARSKGYNRQNISNDDKRKIGIEIDKPINKKSYKRKRIVKKRLGNKV